MSVGAVPEAERLYEPRFIAILVANFLLFANLHVYLVLPVHLTASGLDLGVVGQVMGAYTLSALIAQPIAAAIQRRRGPRLLLRAGLGLIALAGIALAAMPTYGLHYYLARAAQGVGFAFFLTSSLATIAETVPATRRAEAFSMYGLAGLLTMSIAPPLAEALLRTSGAGAFLTVGATAGMFAVAIGWLIPDTHTVRTTEPRALALPADRTLRLIFVAGLLFGFGNVSLATFIGPLALSSGGTHVFPYFVAYTVAGIIARLAAPLANRLPRSLMVASGLAALGIASALMSTAFIASAMIVIGLLAGFAQGAGYTAAFAWVVDRSPADQRGGITATHVTWVFAGMSLAMPAGWLLERAGSAAVFGVVATAFAAGTLIILRVGRPRAA